MLGRLSHGLGQTVKRWALRLDQISTRAISESSKEREEETLESLEEFLLEADLGVQAANRIVARIRDMPGRGTSDFRERIRAEILSLFHDASQTVVNDSTPGVVLVVGVNGTGKTTTVGKLAHLYETQGKTTLVCAADTFRAAAVSQLENWVQRTSAQFVCSAAGADPASVVFDAMKAGKSRNVDVVVVDTAGRLHSRVDLMRQLVKMRDVIAREIPGGPHEVLLVLDATVGQNGLMQSREFLKRVGVTGIVLTKLDGTAKGGIAVGIVAELNIPIRYVGVGEGLEDLIPFSPDQYVDALFENQGSRGVDG